MESRNFEGRIIDEIAPHPLIYCSKYLPKNLRQEFPIINRLDLHSSKWVDEFQNLDSDKIPSLYLEFKRLRRLTRMEEFLNGLDNKKFLEYWKGDEEESNFNAYLDKIEKFILDAIDNNLELKIYL